MTIQQLHYLLEIHQTGSVSQAAKNLFMSQPNLSNAIKSLEHELDVELFHRTSAGMEITPAGKQLVSRAGIILNQLNQITAEFNPEEYCAFRVVHPNYLPVNEAFVELCTRYQHKEHIQFSCFSVTGPRILQLVSQDQCDLGFYIPQEKNEFLHQCAQLQLEFVPLAEAQFYVLLAKDHPLAQQKSLATKDLRNYPYVAFSTPSQSHEGWIPWSLLANPAKCICVQSGFNRGEIVARTHAFSIVMQLKEEYHPLENVVLRKLKTHLPFGYVYSKIRGLSPLSAEHIALLKEILALPEPQ